MLTTSSNGNWADVSLCCNVYSLTAAADACSLALDFAENAIQTGNHEIRVVSIDTHRRGQTDDIPEYA
jgi:hypothetical protein